jgi:hypothetical protein
MLLRMKLKLGLNLGNKGAFAQLFTVFGCRKEAYAPKYRVSDDFRYFGALSKSYNRMPCPLPCSPPLMRRAKAILLPSGSIQQVLPP